MTTTDSPVFDFDKLSRQANSRQLRKRLLLRKFEESLIFKYEGGLFRADLNNLPAYLFISNHPTPHIVVDLNKDPIKIEDINEFIQVFKDTNASAVLAYYNAMENHND